MMWRLAEKIFHNWRYIEGKTMRWVWGQTLGTVQNWISGELSHMEKENYKCESSLPNVRIWGPTLGFHARGSCTRKKRPQNIWLWKAAGLVFEIASVLQERQYLFLMDMCKISHILRPSTEGVIGKEPGSDSLDDLREPPQEAGGN